MYRDDATPPSDSGHTVSLWQQGPAATDVPDMPPLEGDATCDVCVVGAGIAGLTTAYLLAKAGRDVLVIDDNPPAGGESIRTTGHLNSYIDDGLSDLEDVHGEAKMKLAVESHAAAIDRIETICRDEAIDAHFERREEVLFVDPDGQGQDYIEKEHDAAQRAGLPGVRFEPRPPGMNGYDAGRCLVIGGQATFHAGRYFAGLAAAIVKHGGRLRRAHATHITGTRVETDDGKTITCGHTATCTNTPINPAFADLPVIHMRQAPYRTYVVALRLPEHAVPGVMYSDTLDPYHYVRPAHDGEGPVLMVGGQDHKTGHKSDDPGDAQNRFDRLTTWAKRRWPEAGEVVARWSGQVQEPHDFLAFIGRNVGDDDTALIATGDSGMGLTHGTIAGMVLSDIALGVDNPYADLYDPRREPASLSSTGRLVKENLDVTLQYKDLILGGEVSDVAKIKPGTGATLRRGTSKLAVYRDDAGDLHERSAVCPHMGCIVHWNHLEKTWDCPCHGGRYAKDDGRVLTGPATSGLAEV